MPDGFYKREDKRMFGEPFARYIETGLHQELEQLPSGMLWYQVL